MIGSEIPSLRLFLVDPDCLFTPGEISAIDQPILQLQLRDLQEFRTSDV
ncbi:MAG: hypothetical protein P8J37_12890 [Fuerstiella sp.]|nr:hypothetical protein [Fuerstiella sp.]